MHAMLTAHCLLTMDGEEKARKKKIYGRRSDNELLTSKKRCYTFSSEEMKRKKNKKIKRQRTILCAFWRKVNFAHTHTQYEQQFISGNL